MDQIGPLHLQSAPWLEKSMGKAMDTRWIWMVDWLRILGLLGSWCPESIPAKQPAVPSGAWGSIGQ